MQQPASNQVELVNESYSIFGILRRYYRPRLSAIGFFCIVRSFGQMETTKRQRLFQLVGIGIVDHCGVRPGYGAKQRPSFWGRLAPSPSCVGEESASQGAEDGRNAFHAKSHRHLPVAKAQCGLLLSDEVKVSEPNNFTVTTNRPLWGFDRGPARFQARTRARGRVLFRL